MPKLLKKIGLGGSGSQKWTCKQTFQHGSENKLFDTEVETGFDTDVETGFPTKTCKQIFRKGHGTCTTTPMGLIN